MRNALIYLIMLLCMLPLSAQEADTVAVQEADSVEVLPKGRLIPVKGAFLQQLQERDSVLIADQLLYGFELKQVEEGTRFALPEWKNDERGGVQAISPWFVDTLKVHMIKTILSIDHVDHTSFDRLHQHYSGIEICLLVCIPDDPVNECSEEITFSELDYLCRILCSLGCLSVEIFHGYYRFCVICSCSFCKFNFVRATKAY